MNGQQGFFQVACYQCGAAVWINSATGTGTCTSCNTVNSVAQQAPGMAQHPPGMGPPPGMAQHPPGMGPPPAGGFQVTTGGGMSAAPAGGYGIPKLKVGVIVAGALAVGALSVGGYFVKKKFLGGKGRVTYAKLEIDPERATPDQMIEAVEGLAHKWKRDAVWWSINVHNLRADGTVDLTSHAATLKYLSPNRVQSRSKQQRKDAIKEFKFTRNGVEYKKRIGVSKRWTSVGVPDPPACKIADLVSALASRGFTGDKQVRISFDPKTAFAAPSPSWRVWSDDPALNGWFSMTDCSLTKEAKVD